MGGGNDGVSSDEEEEEDGEHAIDSTDERSKVGVMSYHRSSMILRDRCQWSRVHQISREPPPQNNSANMPVVCSYIQDVAFACGLTSSFRAVVLKNTSRRRHPI